MHDKEFWSIFQQTRPLFKKKVASSSFEVGSWSMFQQTRPLYTKPFLEPPPPPPPPIYSWPRKIYVATRLMGVYYTENYDGTAQQPIWTRVNDGLATLDCWEFHLDPFDNENMQFVLIRTGGILYKRVNKGAWEVVLDNAKRQVICGDANSGKNCGGFCFDPTIQGRVWMITTGTCERAFCSNDYGATWTYFNIYCGPYLGTGTIRAHGDYAWSSDSAGIGTYGYMLWTQDRNAHWSWQTVDLLGRPTVDYNPLSPNYSTYGTPQFGHNVGWFTNPANQGLFITDHSLTIEGTGFIWFSPTVLNHQRIIHNNKLHATYDNWASNTFTDFAPLNWLRGTIAPWAGDNENHMLLATNRDHLISTLNGEDNTNLTGIAGANPTVAPYINSIPKASVSGGECMCGIQAVKEAGIVYV